ncbi:MAG: hypothetical protein IPH44_03515 [Myxococcales bacterium]|nr:hypothetical protein [Myxococcales bacterium]MBK7197501.1 hypothetical protein [Myxococcales bacterium]MBP6849126.1 hypothetical protein [Kofleriaceae bacterium]
MSLTRRLLIIVLALVGAAGFAISVEGGRWWSLGGEIHVGPAGTQRCFGGECGVGDLTWVHGSGFWERCGSGAYAGGLVAGLALLALAGSIAARRAGRLAAAVAGIGSVTAIAAGVGFYALAPAIPEASVGRGAVLFAIGAAAALTAIGATLTAKR